MPERIRTRPALSRSHARISKHPCRTLALVKAPYKSLLGLVWQLQGCCGQPGEGSLAFFFGEDNLFDLGEINGELILPVSDTLTLSILVEYPMTGLPTFTLGWQFAWN